MPQVQIIDSIIDGILDLRSKKGIKNVIWEAYYDNEVKCKSKCGKSLKILILNAPCYGFGDLIFAIKFAGYLHKWYGAKVTIATPLRDGLLKLGYKPADSVLLTSKTGKSSASHCRRFRLLKLGRSLPAQDLIFIAPMAANFDPQMSDVRALLPYATMFNTFVLSEYNDDSRKPFDFSTGVGKKRVGLLLTDMSKIKGKAKKIKKPYAVAYIAGPENLGGAEACLTAFLELLAKKYKSHKRFEVVVPGWLKDEELEEMANRIVKKVSPYFDHIEYKGKNESGALYSEGNHTFVLRADILPVPNKEMIKLMKGSVKDILVTGDQSITDALSCCSNKNIFYQIAPWKENFGRELTKLMPNKYLSKKKTSCGTLSAIKYKSNYKKFIKAWDFRELAKPKLDAIILSTLAIKKGGDIGELAEMAQKSKTLKSLKKKVRAWDESSSSDDE